MIYVPVLWRDNDKTLPDRVHLVARINAYKTMTGDYRINTAIDDYPYQSFESVVFYRHAFNKQYKFHVLITHEGYYDVYPNRYEVVKSLNMNLSKMVEILKANTYEARKRGAQRSAAPTELFERSESSVGDKMGATLTAPLMGSGEVKQGNFPLEFMYPSREQNG